MKDKEPIFVIGFPKSGNTWLARLLAEVTQSKIHAAETDVVNAADNSSDRNGPYVIYKKHVVKEVEKILQSKVVYIVRDPRDVLVSAFFFNNPFICENWVKLPDKGKGIKRLLCRAYFYHQIRRMNKRWCSNELSVLMNWVHGNRNTVGSWSDHISYWVNVPGVVVVKYEDLLQNTEIEFKRVLSKLAIDVNDEQRYNAVSNQSFEKKKAEFQRVGDLRNTKFLRSCKSGGWREYLSPSVLRDIEISHARMMNEFGYELIYGEKKQ